MPRRSALPTSRPWSRRWCRPRTISSARWPGSSRRRASTAPCRTRTGQRSRAATTGPTSRSTSTTRSSRNSTRSWWPTDCRISASGPPSSSSRTGGSIPAPSTASWAIARGRRWANSRPRPASPSRASPTTRRWPGWAPPELAQPVELARVLAGDLADDVGGQVAELLLDVLRRLGPHPVGVRIVGAPHEGLDPDVVDELGADAVELKGGLALAAPVVAGLHLQAEVTEAVLPLEVHAVQRVGQPADPALPERDAHLRVALEHGRADDRGHDIDEVHLEAGDAGELGGPAGEPGLLIAHVLGQRREGMEVQW